ncbi:MAG: DUF4340 domain-containing protein [Spirochaetia bacterium]|nr:DUF4340 domain-containing protein [Spirochaetia bacterium]
MKGKQILIAAIAFALLGGYYWFFEVKKKGEDDRTKAQTETILKGLASSGAVEVQLNNAQGGFTMKKEGTQWTVNGLPADGNVVETMITRFGMEKYDRTIEGAVMPEFGIGAASVRFKAADGKEYALLLGNTTPTGSNVYAAVEGDTSTVYMASTQVKTDAEQGLFYWRLKTPEILDEAKTTKIVSNIKDKKFILEKDASGAWQLVSPVKEPGKKERISSFIMDFRTAQAKSFSKSTAGRGLDGTEYIAFYEGAKEKKIVFGSADAKQASRWAKSALYSEALEMPEACYTAVPEVDEIIDRKINNFEQANAAKLTVVYAGRELIADKKKEKNGAEKWEIKTAKGIDDKDKKSIFPSSIVASLNRLEYKEKVARTAAGDENAAYGFSAGEKEIKVMDEKGGMLADIMVGKAGNKDGLLYVKNMMDGKIYQVEGTFASGLGLPGFTAEP